MTKFNRFNGRSGKFNCRMCGRVTRDVNGINGNLELCEACQYRCEADNAEADYGKDSEEHRAAMSRYERALAKRKEAAQ